MLSYDLELENDFDLHFKSKVKSTLVWIKFIWTSITMKIRLIKLTKNKDKLDLETKVEAKTVQHHKRFMSNLIKIMKKAQMYEIRLQKWYKNIKLKELHLWSMSFGYVMFQDNACFPTVLINIFFANESPEETLTNDEYSLITSVTTSLCFENISTVYTCTDRPPGRPNHIPAHLGGNRYRPYFGTELIR